MNTQLFIPSKIKVGYQERTDTYTKRLAYVIYYDAKNKLRKETSWKGWIQAKLGTPDYDNKPTEGFVLNKDVGGVRHSWSSWNSRMEKVRVFDPRGFEFEISIPNLLFILQECSSVKGKGLEGEFVYCWDGPELLLLPVKCEEYQKCADFTSLQSNKVGSKELVEGHSYMTKKQDILVYLGRYTTYGNLNHNYGGLNPGKEHVFYNPKDKTFLQSASPTTISHIVDNQPNIHFAEYVDKLQKNSMIGKVTGLTESNHQVKFSQGSYYPDYSLPKGKYYEHNRRSRYEDCNLEGTFDKGYIKQENGSYALVNIGYKRKRVKTKDLDYYVNWEIEGYTLSSSNSLVLSNEELVVKPSKNPYDGKLYTIKELRALPIIHLTATLNKKQQKLFYG